MLSAWRVARAAALVAVSGILGPHGAWGQPHELKSVDFKLNPMLFADWNDRDTAQTPLRKNSGDTCTRDCGNDASDDSQGREHGVGNKDSDDAAAQCLHCGRPDTQIQEKLSHVRDYYNSDRAIALMTSPQTLGEEQFHSGFSVGRLDDNEFLARLAKVPLGKKLQNGTPRFRVLDYGCGLGRLARLLADACESCEVHGVNIAEAQVDVARNLTPEGKVDFRSYDGVRLPYENSSFDAVLFQESYSFHTPNQCGIAAEFARVLRSGGRIAGLDWMAATGLTEAEYMHWIGPINLAWEASTGSPESLARCFRAAGLIDVEYLDTAHLGGIPKAQRPVNQFLDDKGKEEMRMKYGSLSVQLSHSSFSSLHRHLYALESMALAIENKMYWEGFITAKKPQAA